MKRTATAVWKGTGLEGKGSLTTISGAFKDHPYSYKTRFENEDGKAGTNPEELMAAAHAGCFNMALSFQIVGAGFTANELNTIAEVHMGKEGHDYFVDKIDLHLTADVPGISEEKFMELAENAKKGCPISQALSAVDIHLHAKLK